MLRRVALVRTDVSEELSASFIRVFFTRSAYIVEGQGISHTSICTF
jgi:hypothetical protein